MNIIQEESFGIIPLKQDKEGWKVFLILHLQGNHWGFPKGRKNEGEEAKEAAMRELKEETGLKLDSFLQETPFIEHYHFRRKGNKILKIVYYFPALVSGEYKLQPEEIREGRWLLLKEAPDLLTFKGAKTICDEVLSLLKS